jgi:two-component system, sensor histidine kinase and response regulator
MLMAEYHEKWDLGGVNIKIEIQQNSPFFSDESKIRVILNNLFSNAFKFQKENGEKHIKIAINVMDGEVRIEVADNGIGIEEKHRADVFNLFHRATQRNVGSGLGLYMVKESVEQLKGNVLLSSNMGSGTTITVHLPDLKQG